MSWTLNLMDTSTLRGNKYMTDVGHFFLRYIGKKMKFSSKCIKFCIPVAKRGVVNVNVTVQV